MYRSLVTAFSSFYLLSHFILGSPAFAEDKAWLEPDGSSSSIEMNLPTFAPIIDKLGAAVVNISVEGRKVPHPLAKFFEGQPRPSQRAQNMGSGFVIHPDGYIVTNNHVVEGAEKIFVALRDDKKQYPASVIGRDPKTDIALLKVDADQKLQAVVLGDSEQVQPGDWVIAIGNPFQLGHTATVGIVSALGRRVQGSGPYDDFIQTDASINPGNSGGPLFNAKGEVVGVNTAIYSPGRLGASGFNIGIGFAIPINLAKDIIQQLRSNGRVTRGWLGVLVQTITEDIGKALSLDASEGALVAQVMEDSPADKSGFQRSDIIIKFDGHEVMESDDLPLLVARTPIGKIVDVEIRRDGRRKVLKVKIEELEEAEMAEDAQDGEELKLGLQVQDLTPDLARSLNLESDKGVVVSQVTPGSAAEEAGIRRGDVILEAAGEEVTSSKVFRRIAKKHSKDTPLLLLVRRRNMTIFLTLKSE